MEGLIEAIDQFGLVALFILVVYAVIDEDHRGGSRGGDGGAGYDGRSSGEGFGGDGGGDGGD